MLPFDVEKAKIAQWSGWKRAEGHATRQGKPRLVEVENGDEKHEKEMYQTAFHIGSVYTKSQTER